MYYVGMVQEEPHEQSNGAEKSTPESRLVAPYLLHALLHCKKIVLQRDQREIAPTYLPTLT